VLALEGQARVVEHTRVGREDVGAELGKAGESGAREPLRVYDRQRRGPRAVTDQDAVDVRDDLARP